MARQLSEWQKTLFTNYFCVYYVQWTWTWFFNWFRWQITNKIDTIPVLTVLHHARDRPRISFLIYRIYKWGVTNSHIHVPTHPSWTAKGDHYSLKPTLTSPSKPFQRSLNSANLFLLCVTMMLIKNCDIDPWPWISQKMMDKFDNQTCYNYIGQVVTLTLTTAVGLPRFRPFGNKMGGAFKFCKKTSTQDCILLCSGLLELNIGVYKNRECTICVQAGK